ncbi:2Fe-2S iron-sulfur cluster-binding protein [Solimonas terrae]|uniref:2Fe-2S iron-sulfur cluster binding domain-containing protein n=1 Tax=Solimonas terrae TaxID=1396819 RepID=A0A6M2BQF4_9GAMM|nr:2Fe-2S iron-sulfur cluster-binding protein [Solimonas terrae]NGY04317.1 2Fe-2S iron-sulfur cluster binding domain-containing protein [Solimonas terrae]
MTRAVFITTEGERIALDCGSEPSMMRVAVANGVPGIDADCGGSMVCGTCHVHVPEDWLAKLPPKSSMEAEILDYVPEPHPRARLSCQIPVDDATDGIELTIPRSQR